MFLQSFTVIRTCALTLSETPQKLASQQVLERYGDDGRMALEVNNAEGQATVYVGDENVTAATGIPIPAGEKRIFPVQKGSSGYIYGVGSGKVIIAEYF